MIMFKIAFAAIFVIAFCFLFFEKSSVDTRENFLMVMCTLSAIGYAVAEVGSKLEKLLGGLK